MKRAPDKLFVTCWKVEKSVEFLQPWMLTPATCVSEQADELQVAFVSVFFAVWGHRQVLILSLLRNTHTS